MEEQIWTLGLRREKLFALRSGYTKPGRAAYNKPRFAGEWLDAAAHVSMKIHCRA
ncbi:MAG: hypothetical protein HY018_09420 [Hydrogenophilales bacterium]|nr:hypothetical protein [Hydrogenophilales bacterium]